MSKYFPRPLINTARYRMLIETENHRWRTGRMTWLEVRAEMWGLIYNSKNEDPTRWITVFDLGHRRKPRPRTVFFWTAPKATYGARPVPFADLSKLRTRKKNQ